MKTRPESYPPGKKADSGFTLLELLTVIAIIGILAAIALPALSKARIQSKVGIAKAQLKQFEAILAAYYGDYDTFPPMGNDYLRGDFFPSEDVGTDGEGPFTWVGPLPQDWVVNPAYADGDDSNGHGPDKNGTEGNHQLDANEDIGILPWLGANDFTKGNGRLDGTFLDRLRDRNLISPGDYPKLIDVFSVKAYYHYYGGYVRGARTTLGHEKFRTYNDDNSSGSALDEYAADSPPYYNRYVVYSVGPDGRDHALHNYYITVQDGEDVGADAFASDPADIDNDYVLFEPDDEELDGGTSDAFLPGLEVWETTFGIPSGPGIEEAMAGPGSSALEGPDGTPDFDYDSRMSKHSRRPLPDGSTLDGVIMLRGP